MNKKVIFFIFTAAITFSAVIILRLSGGLSNVTTPQQSGWMLPLVMAAALVDSVNPCAFSILLLTIAFLFSIGRVRRNILLAGGVYIGGIFTVYMLIGIGVLQTLYIFNTPNFMGKLGALLLICVGVINTAGELFPAFPIKLKIPSIAHRRMAIYMEKASIPAAFMLGVLVGLFEFPCTGGPYLMVLGLLHDAATYVPGFLYLILYNLVFVFPLVLILLIATDKELLRIVKTWKKKNIGRARLTTGIVMILLGLLIFII